MRGTSSASLGPLPRIDNSQKWGQKEYVHGSGRFVRGVRRHYIALNAVYSPVLSRTCPTRRLDISPRRAPLGRPYTPAVAAARGGCQRDRRIYYISNDTANAGPPAGPRGVRPGPLSRLV